MGLGGYRRRGIAAAMRAVAVAVAVVFFMSMLSATEAACSVQKEAMRLLPCYSAAQDANAAVSAPCCTAVRQTTDYACLCQALLSDVAKSAGINPAIAMTIPKRCSLANRPVGYKCGPYVLP